jgi:hypothetical protein
MLEDKKAVSYGVNHADMGIHDCSESGRAQTPAGSMNVLQMLNFLGQRGGELVTVVPAGAGLLEWIFKFLSQVPEGL